MLLLLLAGLGYRAAGQAVPLSKRLVPLDSVRITASHLRPRVLGSTAGGVWPFYGLDYNAPGNQVGERLYVAQPSWLESVSFSVAQCSYDSLFLRVQVYRVAQEFPGVPLLPPTVAMRLARRDLRHRVTLDLRPYRLRLTGDVVVSLELLRAQGPGTLTFSASRASGPLYKLDLPGDSTTRNIAPVGTRLSSLHWQQGAASPWRKNTNFSVGISAVVLPEFR
ncbi:MAG: hypothetical protein ACRYFK_04850 [Janthinobacterium lividum]